MGCLRLTHDVETSFLEDAPLAVVYRKREVGQKAGCVLGEVCGNGQQNQGVRKVRYFFKQGITPNTNQNAPWNHRWRNSDNFLANLSYNIVNDAFQVIQTFDFDLIASGGINPLTGKAVNQNIDGTPNYNPIEGFVNTLSSFIPTGRGFQGVNSLMPKGLGYLQKLNTAQFSKVFKGNLSRLSSTVRGKLNRVLNKGINYFNKQIPTGMFLLKTLKFKEE